MVEKILNNTTPYGKIRASHEGSLHSSTLILIFPFFLPLMAAVQIVTPYKSRYYLRELYNIY